jgi:hypothetical protein
MKIRTLVVAFVLAILYPTVSNAEDVIATLNPIGSNAANAPQFTVYKTTWQEARRRKVKCRTYGESCVSKPAMHDASWSYDGLVDNCCPRWICLYPGPTCQ